MSGTTKIADDIFMVPWDQGNGQIRREVWGDGQGNVTRYHLAYFNSEAFNDDEGRILGYDYEGGKFVFHLRGEITSLGPLSFSALEELFAIKWANLPKDSGPPSTFGEAASGNIDVNKIDEMDEYAETRGMKMTITKGISADFFKRGKELALRLERGEHVEPEKVVIFGHRDDLCYSMLPKR